MTYYQTTYEFTAFTEADLLQGVNGSNLGCGDTFKMPAYATTCITVKDDDKKLSGDYYCNENADDHYGQRASITGEGGSELGNGGQIYAESYHVLHGSDGKTYYLIEIEQEGTGDDYFTFWGDVPAEGVCLTIVETCNIKYGVDYDCLGAGDKEPETGSISGTVFCDLDCDGINGEKKIIPGCDYTVEAEDMWGYGFKDVYSDTGSGGKIAKLYCWDGKLETCFQGKEGTYDLKIRVQDEKDGQSTIKVKVNGMLVEAIRLDRDSDGYGSNDGPFSTYVIKDVPLDYGDKVTLHAWADGYEYVRIDKIDFEGQDKVVYEQEPVKEGVLVKLVDLHGNVVAETTTDADGNYRFDNVPVGDYKIMGVAPDGTEFTIQDAGADDSIDSDVDANGMSGVVTVTGGSETDIDLGVCEKPEPGSLSGRYFCDTNDNDQDDGNGGEPGIAGVQVMLISAGVVMATTFTDANGEYSFGGLEAGFYSVKFTDPDGVLVGKTLVNPNVGDDASDSDAIGDTVMSVIENIEVFAGKNTPDNDAGVEDVNDDPEPQPDEAKTCADETVMVDVLANDSDPDGDSLTITMVDGQAIAEGGSVVTSVGTIVSLIGGKLVVDGEAAYAALDIGQEAVENISYKVEDGNGGSATSNLEMTFCGDANSVASLAASLPEQICFEIPPITTDPAVLEEYFVNVLSGSGDARFDGLTVTAAYCLDYDADLTYSVEIKADMTLATAASATAAGLKADIVNSIDEINWILNQDFGSMDNGDGDGKTYTDAEIQGAIWNFTNPALPDSLLVFDGAGTDANALEIYNLALANGGGYMPGEGDVIGILLDPIDGQTFPGGFPDGVHTQPFILGIEFEDIDCLCSSDTMIL